MKIKKSKIEIVKLTAQEALLAVYKLVLPFYEADRIYRVSARKLRHELENQELDISNKIYYLKKHGYIQDFVQDKEKYVELTPKGVDRVDFLHHQTVDIVRPIVWDKKWRIVIFDIPEDKRGKREVLRRKLIKMGFEKIQESVYVYPFECTVEISRITNNLYLQEKVLIMVSEIFQGEENIIKNFLDNGVLNPSDLRP